MSREAFNGDKELVLELGRFLKKVPAAEKGEEVLLDSRDTNTSTPKLEEFK